MVVQTVTKDLHVKTESFAGTLTATRKSTIGSAVEERVAHVFVERGDRVGRDQSLSTEETIVWQPLARLESQSLELEIAGANTELKLREKALNELEQSLPRDIELGQGNRGSSRCKTSVCATEL